MGAGFASVASMSESNIATKRRKMRGNDAMMKNLTRGVLGLVLTAAATWLANYIVEQVFGPDDEQQAR